MRICKWCCLSITALFVGCVDSGVTSPAKDDGEAERRVQMLSYCAIAGRSLHDEIAVGRLPLHTMPFSGRTLKKLNPGNAKRFHVVTARLAPSMGQEVGVACIVPSSVSVEEFSTMISTSPAKVFLPLLEHTLDRSIIDPDAREPIALVASVILMNPLLEPLRHTKVSTKGLDTQPDASNGASCCEYRIPRIEVVVYSWAYLVNMSNLHWFFHRNTHWGGTSQVYDVDTYYNNVCPAASDKYMADYEKLQELEADSAAYHNTAAAVMNYVCEPQADGKTKCIDLFISSERTFVIGYGDNRTFDGDAKYKASRVQMYIDFDNLSGTAYINGSAIGFGPFTETADPYPHQPKDFVATRRPDGAVVIEFHFYNGFCSWAGRAACPAIDGFIEFKQQADGSWKHTAIVRDEYPSIAIYQQQSNGTFLEEYRAPEGHWSALVTRGRTLQKWREEMQLPPGCQLQ